MTANINRKNQEMARGDYAHPPRAYLRLRRWYRELAPDERKKYKKSRGQTELLTVLGGVLSCLTAVFLNSPLPLLGLPLVVIASAVYTARLRRRFGFGG
jgi:hypothetical protein